MGDTHESQITTWQARLSNTYGSHPAAGADYRRIVSNDRTVFEFNQQNADDAGYDTGSDEASDIWAETNDAGVTIPFDFNFQDIGYALYDALGGYAVTTLQSGVYQHVFTPLNVNVSRQLPARAYGKKYGGYAIKMLWDGITTVLNIAGTKTGKLKCSKTIKGSGDYDTDPASYAQPALESDREYGYAQQARFWLDKASTGTAQVETATAAGTASASGDAPVTVTSNLLSGGSKVVQVAITNGDNASAQGAAIRNAFSVDADIIKHYFVGGTGANIVLTARLKAANDGTLNIAIAAGSTGITAVAASANTTAGVAGDTQQYSCKAESWNINLSNGTADEGYTPCSEFLIANDPRSGAVRSEYQLGVRDYMFNFEAKLQTGDKMLTFLRNRENLTLEVPITGVIIPGKGYYYSLVMQHTKARVIAAPEQIVNGFVGISGQVKLLSADGSIPLTFTLINDVASYAS